MLLTVTGALRTLGHDTAIASMQGTVFTRVANILFFSPENRREVGGAFIIWGKLHENFFGLNKTF